MKMVNTQVKLGIQKLFDELHKLCPANGAHWFGPNQEDILLRGQGLILSKQTSYKRIELQSKDTNVSAQTKKFFQKAIDRYWNEVEKRIQAIQALPHPVAHTKENMKVETKMNETMKQWQRWQQ